MLKKIMGPTSMVFFGFLLALNYLIFVFPNNFAPAGIDGICTMIQYISKINIGYLAFLANIPLIIFAFLFLSRDFAIKSTIYIISFSLSSIFLKHIDISAFYYKTDTGTSIVLAPIVAGTVRGILYYLTLNRNGSAGGVDIVAALVKRKKPYFNLMNIIFVFNACVAISSYFVYGMKPEPVICSIIYSFVTSTVSNHMRLAESENVKFEIVSPSAEKLCKEISDKFHQSATIIDAHGSYSGNNTQMVLCVVNKKNVPYIENIILKYPNCVVFKSTVGNSITGISYK